MEKIIKEIEAELEFANAKHPFWPVDSVHASAILNEEAGKLTQACIDWEDSDRQPEKTSYTAGVPTKDRMRKKAVSTAAMAIRFLQGFEDY